MKKRAIDIALAKKRAQVEAKKDEARLNAALILSLPDVKSAHEKYVNATFKNALGGFDEEEKVARDTYLSALAKHGRKESDMVFVPACPICGDTGNAGGKLCRCVWSEYISALKAICEIERRAPFTFAYANFYAVKDGAQRENLKKLYAYFKAYADKLPNVKAKSVVLFGGIGTGKTCLASAIAREAIERGKSAKVVSAYEFNSNMLEAHTSPICERNARLKDYLTADLLVIDDLGTEPMLKNVTVEYLLLVIEERQNKGLPTLITTNFSPARLLDRYGERIYSRLSNKHSSRIIEIGGKDLRLN